MSKETKWTPGPWVSGGRSGRMIQPKSKQGFEYWVADVDTAANAHLIAAAPELYEALECCANWFSSGDYNLDCIRKAKAALAKARGEQ